MTRTILLAALGWTVIGTISLAAEPPALPRPPRQDDPWTPPKSDLPIAMVEAARVLFEQGLADPRGCAYRQVELAGEAGAFPNRIRMSTIHAFVIPFDVTGDPRYAVAWNGLVYPVKRLGPAADLDDDILAFREGVGPFFRGEVPRIRLFSFMKDPIHEGRGDHDIHSAWQDDLAPMKVALLLRLGRADLAEVVWKAGTSGRIIEKADIYAILAADWEWALFGRAARAHGRADDTLALATIRELARVRPLIVKEAPERPRRPDAYLTDIPEQIPRFLADQERRARERSQPPRHKPSDHIAALIRDLDEIRGARWPQRSNLTSSPTVQALIAEGDAAVGPLLDCLEHDNRLTRAVRTWDDMQDVGGGLGVRRDVRYLEIHGVDWAAYLALTKILNTNDFGPWPRDLAGNRKKRTLPEHAAIIRAYWKRYGGTTPTERAFRTLADDTATQDRWIRAAEELVHPDFPGPFRPLRSREHPSVAELLTRRSQEIDPPGGQSVSATAIHMANGMASLLADWDRKASLPTLAARVKRTAVVLGPRFSQPDGDDGALAFDIARLTRLRAEAGDPAALEDYAAWARTIQPPSVGRFPVDVFEPLWTYPDHPAIVAATRALFDDAASPWVPLLGPGDRGWGGIGSTSDILCSPMLRVPSFRAKVLARLADERSPGALPRPVRLGDKAAWKLSQIWGFPRFELSWTRLERDRAIAEAAALLIRYGDRLQSFDSRQWSDEDAPRRPAYPRTALVLPPLDRPATPDDVSSGRAIFAAPPGHESRIWPMPSRPMMGIWTTMPIPSHGPRLRSDEVRSERTGSLTNLRRGVVWQAEEVREESGWRLYYGFVGQNVIAGVPAEEIDFPEFPTRRGRRWNQVSRDLDAKLLPPGRWDDGRRIRTDPVAAVGPMPIVLSLRNHRGIEVPIPSEWVRPDETPSLREGVTIRLRRQPEPVEPGPVAGLSLAARRSVPMPFPWPEKWPVVVARREPARFRSEATRTLAPTESAEVLRLDLRPLYGPIGPGHYRVEVERADIKAEAMFEVK